MFQPSAGKSYHGCIRTVEEVLAESPQLQIIRGPPPQIGKRFRYVTVFRSKEEGKRRQTFSRARSWELPKTLEPWREQPTGWDDVSEVTRAIFRGVDEDDEDHEDREEIVVVLPIEVLSVQ